MLSEEDERDSPHYGLRVKIRQIHRSYYALLTKKLTSGLIVW